MSREKLTTIVIRHNQPEVNLFPIPDEYCWPATSSDVGRFEKPRFSFYKLSNLSSTTELELVHDLGNGEIVPINLNPLFHRRLKEYFIKNIQATADFDCASFVYFLYDIPYIYSYFNISDWNSCYVDKPQDLPVGMTLLMGHFDDFYNIDPKHMAVSVGENIFMSKLGTRNLAFTTYEQLKHIYQTTANWVLEPRIKCAP